MAHTLGRVPARSHWVKVERVDQDTDSGVSVTASIVFVKTRVVADEFKAALESATSEELLESINGRLADIGIFWDVASVALSEAGVVVASETKSGACDCPDGTFYSHSSAGMLRYGGPLLQLLLFSIYTLL